MLKIHEIEAQLGLEGCGLGFENLGSGSSIAIGSKSKSLPRWVQHGLVWARLWLDGSRLVLKIKARTQLYEELQKYDTTTSSNHPI